MKYIIRKIIRYIKIRKAIKEDSYNIAKLIVESWQTAYKGLINDNYLNLEYDLNNEYSIPFIVISLIYNYMMNAN